MPLECDLRGGPLEKRELSRTEVCAAISLRLKHVVDECPKRNVIFEVDADYSEDALVLVVDKLRTKFDHVDVIVHDNEYVSFVVDRLKKALEGSTVVFAEGVAKYTGVYSFKLGSEFNPHHNYSVTVATLHHFLVANFDDLVRGEVKQNSAVILYRMEQFLDRKELNKSYEVESIDAQITPLLRHIYRTVDVLGANEVLPKLREFIKRQSDRFVYRFLEANIEKLVESAREAKDLVQGAHFGFVAQPDGSNQVVLSPAHEKEHLALLQFVQIHHSLAVTPFKIDMVRQTPLNLLRGYGRVMGVVRRGGYELRQWLPYMTLLSIYPSRVYPHERPIIPLASMPPAATVSEWIVQVELMMMDKKMIPQTGVRLVVCPSTSAMNQLWRYLKYSHNEKLASIPIVICTTMPKLEQAVMDKSSVALTTVLTTATHFATWHARYMGNIHNIMVFLGTPRKENAHYMHRAFRFARPIFNLVTVPLERSGRNPNDSGIDSCSEEELIMQTRGLVHIAQKVDDRNHWSRIFMEEMANRGIQAYEPILNPDDERYGKCVEWMIENWKKDKNKDTYDEWKRKMMEKYRSEIE